MIEGRLLVVIRVLSQWPTSTVGFKDGGGEFKGFSASVLT